jgi:signal transduction histidine kinase
MISTDLTGIMREYRVFAPQSLRSALRLLSDEFRSSFGIDAAAVVLPREKTIYLSNWPEGLGRSSLENALNIGKGDSYLWISLGGGDGADEIEDASVSVLDVPIYEGEAQSGRFVLIKATRDGFDDEERSSVPTLSEFLSSRLPMIIDSDGASKDESCDESEKLDLLSSINNDGRMKRVLDQLMYQAGCEFCAFHTDGERERMYIMLEASELSPHIEQIKRKLVTAYRMFSNGEVVDIAADEQVFFRNDRRNVAYLLGSLKLESYFLVPVMFASKLRGVLFFGSVRRDAFGKDQIERFKGMAEEDESCEKSIYQPEGGIESLERLLGILPFGGAIVSQEGMIIYSNTYFGELLRVQGEQPETVHEIQEYSPFNMNGIWEEFRVLRRDLVDRELHADAVPGAAVAVTWISLEGIMPNSGSLVLIKDVTESAKNREETEEILATAAHELKTPLTALKNSIGILKDSGAVGVTTHERGEIEYSLPGSRFIETAMRTIDRLVMIVNGLGNVTEAKTISRPFKPERVHIEAFLNDASLFFLDSMKKKEIEFGIEISDHVSGLEFDPSQMEQVIHNLLSNSIKHVPGGGSIKISAEPSTGNALAAIPHVPWEHVGEPTFVDISIQDSGSGIPADVIEEINPSRKPVRARNILSRGLGLYIASRLIRNHGGSLVIDRPIAGGSKVHMFLPADPNTGSAIRAVYMLKENLEDMIKRGLSPVIYVISKESEGCWLEILGGWKSVPVINPEQKDINDVGLYFWPLGPQIALGITANRRFVASPLSIVHDGRGTLRVLQGNSSDRVHIGWAVTTIDGISYSDLIEVALQRTAAEKSEAALKGETEWTGTGF